MSGFSTAKLIGFGIAALALIGFLAWVNGLRNERNELKAWQDGLVTVVTAEVPVDRRKTVNATTVADEVRWLGREYRTLIQALERQSQQLRQAQQQTEAAQDSATEAARRAQESDKARKALRDRLTAPTRSSGLSLDEWSQL